MASAWYMKGLTELCKAGQDLDNGNLKMALINTGYTYSNAHDFYDDVSASVIDTPKALSNVTFVTSGGTATLDADNPATWSSVAGGSTVIAVATYWDSGTPGTSPLITFNDVTDTPTNGGDITITINASGLGTITF